MNNVACRTLGTASSVERRHNVGEGAARTTASERWHSARLATLLRHVVERELAKGPSPAGCSQWPTRDVGPQSLRSGHQAECREHLHGSQAAIRGLRAKDSACCEAVGHASDIESRRAATVRIRPPGDGGRPGPSAKGLLPHAIPAIGPSRLEEAPAARRGFRPQLKSATTAHRTAAEPARLPGSWRRSSSRAGTPPSTAGGGSPRRRCGAVTAARRSGPAPCRGPRT